MLKRTFFALALLLMTARAGACPLCKDSLPNDQGVNGAMKNNMTSRGENISGGINKSILLMFGGLFGSLGLVIMAVVRGARSSDDLHKKD